MVAALYYPIFLTLTIVLTMILIPRDKYIDYFVYGFILGGLGDFILNNALRYLGFTGYLNAGIFDVGGINILSPLSWVTVAMLFLRFLPQRRIFTYLYILTFAVFGVAHGYVVNNAGLYTFRPWLYPIPAFFFRFTMFGFMAWIFKKTSGPGTP